MSRLLVLYAAAILLGTLASLSGAPPVACCSANLQPGCPANTTIQAAVIQSNPACISSWSANCVDLTKAKFPAWCPVPPINCQATCDYLGPDGVQCFWEQCDDGNTNNGDGCTNACELARCGDGIVHNGVEQCDDGNTVNTDACTNNCTWARCGDGIVETGVEQCDDGNANNYDNCLTTCRSNTCGDGYVNLAPLSSEQCDTGNFSDTGACRPGCLNARCGDGFVWTGHEQCDNAAANSDTRPNACRLDCSAAHCGDGVVDTNLGETCDVLSALDSCCQGCSFSTSTCSACLNTTHLDVGSCASGTCSSFAVSSCFPYTCDVSSSVCLTSCARNGNCAPGYVCVAASCVIEDTAAIERAGPPPPVPVEVGAHAFLVGGVVFLALLFALLVLTAVLVGTARQMRAQWDRRRGRAPREDAAELDKLAGSDSSSDISDSTTALSVRVGTTSSDEEATTGRWS